ncbi:MAG: BamA/TamA family outer membrane protein [Candidatus Krumholzibacteriota bacterium]
MSYILKSTFFVCLAFLLFTTPVVAETDPDFVPEPDPVLTAINIEGNQKADTVLVERIMGLKIGQTLNMDQTDDAWDALEDCGYFRFVEIDYDDSADGEVVLNVIVEEDMTTFYGPVIKYSRRHKYMLGAWAEQRNLRGKGETARAEFSAYYIQNGLLSWHRPWLLGIDGLEGTLTATGEQAEFVYRPTRYRKWDLDWEMKWKFAGPFFVMGGADYGYFRQRDPFNWTLPVREVVPPAGSVRYEASAENHWVFRGAIGLDSRSNPYYPRRGIFVQGMARGWSSNGFESYLETSLDTRLFVPLPIRKHVLALRAWGRQTDGATNLDNGLYFGGPESVRGYPYAQREGEEGYLLSAEYRAPLFLMPISPRGEIIGAGFHFFADAGDAWFHGAEAGRSMFSFGAGFHLNIDTLQLRFEAARTREGDWMFEFFDKFNF